jgi:hypothetical protein
VVPTVAPSTGPSPPAASINESVPSTRCLFVDWDVTIVTFAKLSDLSASLHFILLTAQNVKLGLLGCLGADIKDLLDHESMYAQAHSSEASRITPFFASSSFGSHNISRGHYMEYFDVVSMVVLFNSCLYFNKNKINK